MMMKALYITSLHRFSGKTAVCLALGRRLQEEGYQVGYFKPVSAHPWEPIPGRVLDEDADFVRRTLDLDEALEDMVGVVLTPKLVRDMRCGCSDRDLMPEIEAVYQRAVAGKDVVLVEGGASLREGLSLGVDPLRVADVLDVSVLAIIRFRNYVSMADACVVARQQLGERLIGTLVNAVPDENRTARFRCVICLVDPKGRAHTFSGKCEGRIAHHARGHAGFGYDPVFIPDGNSKTFGELGLDVKRRLSHRARAMEKAVAYLRKHGKS
jgi:BioD-like phosphotransacetylase family protein